MVRIRILLLFFVLCFIAVLVKLFYIQVIEPQRYAKDFVQSRKLYPERGRILDRNLQPLAVNQTTYRLYIEPQKMKDKDKLVDKLDDILKIGESTLEARIDENKVWVAVTGNLSKEMRDKINALKMPEIGFENESKRFYPESSLSAHILGFVGKDEQGENLGYFGVEGYYEKELVGLPGFIKSERDAYNKPIFVGTQDRVEAENGRDLVLTVDRSVQNMVKTKLVDAVENFGAKEACAVVADPKTMEIISMVCIPDFDPDKYYEASPEAYVNTSISRLYEPGSTFKPLVVAAAIEEKVVRPLDTFDEKGPLEVSGYTIRNWNNKYHGKTSIPQILERSSNIGMVYLGNKLGPERLYDYVEQYGFGKPTGIDLQGEARGTLKTPEQMYEIDYATTTFGQGIAVTPIQLVRAFASLVNGGYLMKPYIVKEVHQGAKVREREPKVEARIISKNTSDVMKKMLQSAVENAEAKFVFPKEYKIGGKTGTAQVAIEGTYDEKKTIASFIGFAPVEDPKFIALVIVREPTSSQWGSETAAPVFFEIAKELFVYYNIVPE